jgi:hypothetical protein
VDEGGWCDRSLEHNSTTTDSRIGVKSASRSDTRSRAIVAGMQLISLLLELVNRFADPILGQAIES